MDSRVFKKIERRMEAINDGSFVPPIQLMFSPEITLDEVITAAAQIVIELERREDLEQSPEVRQPLPARGDVLVNIPRKRAKK